MSDLKNAYALETPQDSVALYAGWAETYDTTFAEAMRYEMPQIVASRFQDLGGRGPVLDVGAGTGLVAQALGDICVDGIDISAEMLEEAGKKGLYRNRIVGDLTQALPIADGTYAGIVSAGTFTHGHVGPDALDGLLRVAERGAVFVLGVNAEHFGARGFAAKFAALAPGLIDFATQDVPIYGEGADEARKNDLVRVVHFRKG